MTFAYNMFILAILARAAGAQLLPVPDAIVSPVLIPCSCQSGSQAAEEMLRAGWERGAGEAGGTAGCHGRGGLGHHPGGLRRDVLLWAPCRLGPD